MQFDNAVMISRPTADVFAFLSDFENLPLWNYAISDTRRTDCGSLGVGARYTQVRIFPRHSSEAFEVTAFQPDRLIALHGTLGPFGAESSYRLEDIDGSTLLTNSMRLEATGVRRLDALKQLLEGGRSNA